MRNRSLMVLLLSLLIAGCAGKADLRQNNAGFLHDYSKLEQDPEDKGRWIWVNPEIDFRQYRSFMIDPVVMQLSTEAARAHQPNPEVVEQITVYFAEAMQRELQPEYPVVDTPGAGVGRISLAITGIVPTRKQLQAWQLLPVALVATAASEATGVRSRQLLMSAEGEINDSVSGVVLSQFVGMRAGSDLKAVENFEITPEQAKAALDYWASSLRQRLDELHGKGQ